MRQAERDSGGNMGLDMVYRCVDRKFSIRFSRADWDTLSRVGKHLPDAVGVLFDVPDFGVKVPVPLTQLRAALDAIDDFLRDRGDILPYTYEFKCEYIPVGLPEDGNRWAPEEFSTGGQSGFRLPGDNEHFYALWAGLDECRLQKMATGTDGKGYTVEVRDMRGVEEFQTANCGRVKIRRRREKSDLREGLAEIRAFLTSVDGPEVIKMLC
jgi:hypothetical protein